jgi:hypothetical protein
MVAAAQQRKTVRCRPSTQARVGKAAAAVVAATLILCRTPRRL